MRTRLGQNFLIDKNIARKIVASAEISLSDTVVEIGPGRGILTEEIEKFSKKIIAVEIDKTLADELSKKFSPALMHKCGIKIVNSDFLKWTPPSKKRLKFIANLPYYISSAVISRILHLNNWDTAVLMVQKEVANRLKALPGSDDYGVLSIACQLFCEVKKMFDVSPGCFKPPPEVTSSVVKLKLRKNRLVKVKAEQNFFRIVKAAFAHRRKTILNSLFTELDAKKEVLQKKLSDTDISPLCRAETVPIEKFINLAKILS